MKKHEKGWLKRIVVRILQFLLNPRFLLCFGIAWMITNGWSYVLLGMGFLFDIGWMMAVGGAYLAFLWLPISPEKIVTVAIAMGLLRWLFPQDEKTLGLLKKLYADLKVRRKERKKKKEQQKTEETELSESDSEA